MIGKPSYFIGDGVPPITPSWQATSWQRGARLAGEAVHRVFSGGVPFAHVLASTCSATGCATTLDAAVWQGTLSMALLEVENLQSISARRTAWNRA